MPVEPIVSEELWTQCNQILNEIHKSQVKPAKRTVNLFSGIVFCSCGDKMYVPSRSPKYTCYDCRNKIGTTDLEEVFHEQLKSFFFSPTEITNYLSNADHVIKEKEELLSTIYEDERKVRQEMDKTYKLYLEDRINTVGFGERYKPLEERLSQMQDQIPEIQAEIDFLKIQYASSDQILHEAKDLYSRWPEHSQAKKRKIVESITEKIIIGEGEVTINLCYLPPASETMTNRQHNLAVASSGSCCIMERPPKRKSSILSIVTP